jgi:hypothetical protein
MGITAWSAASPARSRLPRLAFFVAVLALLGGFVLWRNWPRPSSPAGTASPREANEDPRLTFATPFRNVRPHVKYVGNASCAVCHPDVARTYGQHPMGRSLTTVAALLAQENFTRAANNPFEAGGFRYSIRREAGRVFHQETAQDARGQAIDGIEAEVQFVLGSGAHGRAYLVNRDGFLFQSPVSWYTQKGGWDLAPGYTQDNAHFERPTPVTCLECHCNFAEVIPPSGHHFTEPIFRGLAIGCERCHGPGELHVRAREQGDAPEGVDFTIVNPRHLDHTLREAVCQECHLQGEFRILRRGRQPFDFRPGLPLHLFTSTFVLPPEQSENAKAVSHPEQMAVSRCYRESSGPNKLGCVSCHNPHQLPDPAEKVAYYRSRCLGCHTEQSCSIAPPQRRQQRSDDSCAGCHMSQRPSDVSHTPITDHRILRSPQSPPIVSPPARFLPGQVLLRHFHEEQLDPNDKEVLRDLAIALVGVTRNQVEDKRAVSRVVLPLLEEGLRRAPDDVATWESYSAALLMAGQPQGALAALRTVLDHEPERESALEDAARLAELLKEEDAAVAYRQRAVAVNPWSSVAHLRLGILLARRKEWPRALAAARDAVRINPADVQGRQLLVETLLRTGETQEARTQFGKLLALAPDKEEELRQWFAQHLPGG